jgi:Xaa-Pro aminopeptidase
MPETLAVGMVVTIEPGVARAMEPSIEQDVLITRQATGCSPNPHGN